MSVHVQNISVVMMNNNYNPSWFMHATAADLHLDGTTLHSAKTLIVTAALNEAHVKFFRHYEPIAQDVQPQPKTKPCLAELSFGIALDGALTAAGPIVVEKLQLVMKQTKTFIHDGLYDFIRDANNLNKTDAIAKTAKSNASLNIDELCQRISPIIPKQFVVKIDNAVFSAVKTNSPDDFSAKLQSLTVSYVRHFSGELFAKFNLIFS